MFLTTRRQARARGGGAAARRCRGVAGAVLGVPVRSRRRRRERAPAAAALLLFCGPGNVPGFAGSRQRRSRVCANRQCAAELCTLVRPAQLVPPYIHARRGTATSRRSNRRADWRAGGPLHLPHARASCNRTSPCAAISDLLLPAFPAFETRSRRLDGSTRRLRTLTYSTSTTRRRRASHS